MDLRLAEIWRIEYGKAVMGVCYTKILYKYAGWIRVEAALITLVA